MTHPFHPLSEQQLVCVAERRNRYGTWLLLRIDDTTLSSVPRQWTDLVDADPEIVIGGNRALFRIRDLIELARLMDRLAGRDAQNAVR